MKTQFLVSGINLKNEKKKLLSHDFTIKKN